MPHTVARRSSQDEKWQKVKVLIDKRDKRQCQFLRCLSLVESKSLKVSIPKTLDRAHIFSAGSYPQLIYNTNNIITLSRYIHQRMDNYLSPIDGSNIELSEHYYWWWRIKNHKQDKYDENIDYENLLLEEIKTN